MTAQFPDRFRYRDHLYDLVGISEDTLFDPSTLGLKPVGNCTACYRGYVAVFALSGHQLVLDELHVNLEDPGETPPGTRGPVIHGVKPVGKKEFLDLFNNHYIGLKYPLDYTGGLLLGEEFIQELYVHMGFQPAWKYRKVIELIFARGILKAEYDRSEQMAKIRDQFLHRGSIGDWDIGSEHIIMFIERTFDRRYRWGSDFSTGTGE